MNARPSDAPLPAATAKPPATTSDPVVPAPEPYNIPTLKGFTAPDAVWEYRTEDGGLYGVICRWNANEERAKDIRPLTWNGTRWGWRGFGPKRPLLYLPDLVANPTAPVLVVAGEKTADAARAIAPDGWLVTTWAGGESVPHHSDWKPLRGRPTVVIWPDNDGSGVKCAAEIEGILGALGQPCAVIGVPRGFPEKWDLADAPPDGYGEAKLRALMISAAATCTLHEDEPPPVPAKLNGKHGLAPIEKTDSMRAYIPVGYDEDGYWIIARTKQLLVRYTAARLLKKEGPLDLMPNHRYWRGQFEVGPSDAIPWEIIGTEIMAQCQSVGPFDGDRVRGRGAWIDQDRVVVHLGDKLLVDGQAMAPVSIVSRSFYPAATPLLDIEDMSPLGATEGRKFRDLCKSVLWEHPIYGDLFAGWIASSTICGALKWRPHAWLTGPAGAGKAQPHSARVLTPTGWSTMGEMRVGTLVRTPDNSYARVTAVHPQGRVQVYRFRFSDGRETRATAEHLWKVRVEGEWRLRTTADLVEILGRDTRASTKLAVPLTAPLTINPNGELKLPLHPYVLGVLLGDGHLANPDRSGHAGSITVTTDDPWIRERVTSLLPAHIGAFDTNAERTFRLGDLSRYGRKTRRVIKDLRLLGTRSGTKFIPQAYLDGSLNERIELLRGLMDTDGTIGQGGSLSFCSISKVMAEQVQYLVRSLGGVASMSERHPTYVHNGEKRDGQIAYQINIRLQNRAIAFSLPRKLERAAPEYQYSDCLYLNIKSIEADGEEDCSCITIDHPDRLYITDDFIVTHNSWIISHLVEPALADLAIYPLGNSSEAGIRQWLERDARPVIYDEAEGRGRAGVERREQIIQLMRSAAQESRGAQAKGSQGHDVALFKIRSQFLLASIGVGLREAADIGRCVVLTMAKPEGFTDEQKQARELHFTKLSKAAAALPADLAPRLFLRMASQVHTVRASAEALSKAIASQLGDRREGDTLGTLLAAGFALHLDEPLTDAQAETYVQRAAKSGAFKDFVRTAETREDLSIMQHMATQIVRVSLPNGGSTERAIGEMAAVAAGRSVDDRFMPASADDALRRYGIRVAPDRKGFYIAHGHSELDGLMRDSDYAGGYLRIIQRHPMSHAIEKTLRFHGPKQRATWIPAEMLLGEDDFGVAPRDPVPDPPDMEDLSVI